MSDAPRPLTRAQLAVFLKDHQAIRTMERMSTQSLVDMPDALEDIAQLAATSDARISEAIAATNRLAEAIEALLAQPTPAQALAYFSPTISSAPGSGNGLYLAATGAPAIASLVSVRLEVNGVTQQYNTATQAAYNLGTTVPATSTTRHVFGASGNNGVEVAALAGSPRYVSKRYNGAYATPTKTVNANILSTYRVEGYQETTGAFVGYATFDVVASEDWTSTAQGHKITFRSVATGTITANSTLILQATQTQYHAGAVATPSSTFQGDLASGWYLIGTSNIGMSIAGVKVFDWSTTAATLTTLDLKLATVGKGLYIKEGTNACMGVATLVLGTVVVNTTKVTANSRIQLTAQSLGTVAAPSALTVSARTAGASFTILASQLTDTSVVAWHIVEPA